MFNKILLKDKNLGKLLIKEYSRQKKGIELIASENFTSPEVREVLGSILTNKYSEGLPGKRYYGGNQVIDQIESLCQDRALNLYRLNKKDWGVNVQPYSGSIANISAYFGIINLHDRIMGLDLPSGGHLSHGYYTSKKKISNTSIMFESMPYSIKSDGYIDYEKLEENALLFKPKLIICGASAYPRDFDYKRFKYIADSVDALLMCDMAHISGFIATQEMNNPFEYCDIVTTTTHKTLRGPRAGIIFYKKEFEDKINNSVFPGTQGGPHQNQIGALALQLQEASTIEFKEYVKEVKNNAKVLSNELIKLGYNISTNGTDNHIVLVDLKNKNISGSKVEKICELVDISINKNTVYGDKSPLNPGGIRLGTAAMTTRNFSKEEFIKVAKLLDNVVNLCINIQNKSGKKLIDFNNNVKYFNNEITMIRDEVNEFTENYYFP